MTKIKFGDKEYQIQFGYIATGVTDLTDPYQNILCGTDFISELADKYEDLYLVLMYYNQGEYGGAIEQWESGQYSDYAVSIVERAAELEEAHGKHVY